MLYSKTSSEANQVKKILRNKKDIAPSSARSSKVKCLVWKENDLTPVLV